MKSKRKKKNIKFTNLSKIRSNKKRGGHSIGAVSSNGSLNSKNSFLIEERITILEQDIKIIKTQINNILYILQNDKNSFSSFEVS